MESQLYHTLLWLILMGAPVWSDLEQELMSEDRWVFRQKAESLNRERQQICARVKPTARDIVRRLYAILPYFDREHANSLFLHKYRAAVNAMSEGDDVLDREAAFYAAVLTPVVFLQQYRDTWCLLERFQRAVRLYQISHPTEKRLALKLLQNLRAVNTKVRTFISSLPGPTTPVSSTAALEFDEEDIRDKKDIRYLKELIKNLG